MGRKKGGGQRLMAKVMKNFHFFWDPFPKGPEKILEPVGAEDVCLKHLE